MVKAQYIDDVMTECLDQINKLVKQFQFVLNVTLHFI